MHDGWDPLAGLCMNHNIKDCVINPCFLSIPYPTENIYWYNTLPSLLSKNRRENKIMACNSTYKYGARTCLVVPVINHCVYHSCAYVPSSTPQLVQAIHDANSTFPRLLPFFHLGWWGKKKKWSTLKIQMVAAFMSTSTLSRKTMPSMAMKAPPTPTPKARL